MKFTSFEKIYSMTPMSNGIISSEDDIIIRFHSAYCSRLMEKHLKLYSEISETVHTLPGANIQ
jgi:hypothetical protein